jgi:hypothetical protein
VVDVGDAGRAQLVADGDVSGDGLVNITDVGRVLDSLTYIIPAAVMSRRALLSLVGRGKR